MHQVSLVPSRGNARQADHPPQPPDAYQVAFARHAALSVFRPSALRRLLRERQTQASSSSSPRASPSPSSSALLSCSPSSIQSPFRPSSCMNSETGVTEGEALRLQLQSTVAELSRAAETEETACRSSVPEANLEKRDAHFPEYLKSVQAFLLACKESAKAAAEAAADGQEAQVILVLGNSSADLDSISAAIGYAFFLEICRFTFELASLPGKSLQSVSSAEPYARPQFLPVVHCQAHEFAYRLQTRWWFERCIDDSGEAYLLFADAPAAATLLGQPADSATAPLLALVDHNAMEPSQASLQSNVVAVLDHHSPLPEGRLSAFTAFAVDNPGPSVGSCCTLVSLLFHELSAVTANLVVPPSGMHSLLLGAVAVDTAACAAKLFGTRWSSPDKEMMTALWRRVSSTWQMHAFGSPEDILKGFGRIKFDIPRQLSLGISALMRADYKCFLYWNVCGQELKVGFGALTVPLSVVLQASESSREAAVNAETFANLRDEFRGAAESLIKEQSLGIVVALSSYHRPASNGDEYVLERQMALIGKKELQPIIEGAVCFVSRQPGVSEAQVLRVDQKARGVDSSDATLQSLTDIFFVSQMPVRLSRKVLEPIFREYFACLSRPHAT
ncbi:DHH family protein [Toxoplasma gondii MAS]|uniref:DHH family protein n=2 Tax=Toxoplasma gondii TaxID=5811 RepID=A0A086QRN8_TOXGO|nr:DHH family protein [Toxoplasma gondii MAS]